MSPKCLWKRDSSPRITNRPLFAQSVSNPSEHATNSASSIQLGDISHFHGDFGHTVDFKKKTKLFLRSSVFQIRAIVTTKQVSLRLKREPETIQASQLLFYSTIFNTLQ